MGQKQKGDDFTQGNINSQNQKRNHRNKKKHTRVLSEKHQEIAQSQRSHRQVLMSEYIQMQLVRWKQEQA